MTEKEIKRLNRKDLLILLAEQTSRADRLEEALKNAEKKLAERQLIQDECGTMAEAALNLSNIFTAADDAAALYLENIRQMLENQENLCREMELSAQKEADELLRLAEQTVVQKRKEADQIIIEAYEKAELIIDQAKKEAAMFR